MKLLVNTLSRAVRRAPWAVVITTVIVSMFFGALSGEFTPEEDSNESFAPEAPELDAADAISELFGEESTLSVMQVIVSNGGNVFGLDGLETVRAIEATVRDGAFAAVLAESSGQAAVLSFLSPVEFALMDGAPFPASDAELQALYTRALGGLPDEQAGFAAQLLPASADLAAPSSDKGLMIIFTTGPENGDAIDAFVDLSAAAASEIEATALPAGFTAQAFSFELLFADQDEFQAEVGRLFGTAGLIIIVVLAAVFLVIPNERRKRLLMVGGIAAILVAIALVVLESLAKILPDTLPEAIADWPEGPLFLAAAATVVLVFTLWAASSKRLRRTVADTLVTLVTIFFAISWMNGVGYLIFTEQNPMVQILPILLIGLGVDYSIHVTSRYREEVSEDDKSVDDAIGIAIRTVGIALVLATVTTAVGFLTNLTNEIPALREFGLLAAVGILASFVLMLTFVPAVRELLDRRGVRRGTFDPAIVASGHARALPRIIGSTSEIAKRAPAAALAAALVLGAVGAWGVTNLETKFSFIDFIPTTSPLRTTFTTLLDDFGGGFGESTSVVIEGDVDTAEAWNAMVAANAGAAAVPNVVTFAGNPAGSSPLAAIGSLINPESPGYDQSVASAASGIGLDPATFMVPPGGDVGALYDAAFAAAPRDMGLVLHSNGSGYDAALFDITTQAGEAGAGDMRTDMAEAFEPVTAAGLEAVPTSDEIINDVVVNTLRDSQLSSLALTLLAALVLLVINFWVEARRPMLGVITTIPVALVVLWSFGLMALFGIPFGPVTATIAALAIGIGIPYMIHITHRYLEDRLRNPTSDAAIESTLVHTGGALAGSALTTVAGFGVLVTSTTIPFRQFGFVTAYTILLAMAAAVLILPSMLTLWDNYHRARGDETLDPEAVRAALQAEGMIPAGSGGE